MTITDADLERHAKWLDGKGGGVRIVVESGADLQEADLRWASLQEANLRGANLQGADLRDADLQGTELRGADLREADLRVASLRGASLQEADLRGANLRVADLDFSCFPLWCGSAGIRVDKRLFCQLAAHLCALDVGDEDCRKAQIALLPLAKQSHRAGDLGEWFVKEDEDKYAFAVEVTDYGSRAIEAERKVENLHKIIEKQQLKIQRQAENISTLLDLYTGGEQSRAHEKLKEKYEYLKKIYAVEVKEGDALDEESENIRENVQRARAEEVEAMIERLIDAGNTLRDWRQPNRKRVG